MKDTRKLDVVLQSATGLKRSTGITATYAVVWINPSVRLPTPMDKAHGRNPVWNSTITISLEERTIGQGMYLNIELLCQGLVSTKVLGFVSVDVSDIILEGSKGEAVCAQFHDYPVRRRSGRQRGTLNFEIHLQESPSLLAVQGLSPSKDSIAETTFSPQKVLHMRSKHQQPQPEKEQDDDLPNSPQIPRHTTLGSLLRCYS